MSLATLQGIPSVESFFNPAETEIIALFEHLSFEFLETFDLFAPAKTEWAKDHEPPELMRSFLHCYYHDIYRRSRPSASGLDPEGEDRKPRYTCSVRSIYCSIMHGTLEGRESYKESFAEVFLRIREQNPAGRILFICDNFSSHFTNLIDHAVESLEITRVSLPSYSPDLNPIEPIWNCVYRDLSPRDADTIETCRSLIRSA